jgi:mRNA interferase MazF
MPPKRREVWQVDFGRRVGSEPDKVRPAVVIQNDTLSGLSTRMVVPFYSNPSYAQHRGNVVVPRGEGGLSQDSVAVGHQVRVADLTRFKELLGTLSGDYMDEIELAVAHCLGIAI